MRTRAEGSMGEDSPNRIRILLLEESALFRSSLARVLAAEPDFEMTGACGSAEEALKNLMDSSVNIALLDFDAGLRGSGFLTAAREAGYTGRFMIVSERADAASAASALKLGAAGIFLKSEAPERLAHAIRMVAAGEVWIEPKVIQILAEQLLQQIPPDDGPPSGLEKRERSVLLGILSGLTNREIGEHLGLSENSVKNTVQRLFGKAGVRKRSQLVRVTLEGSIGTAHQTISRQSQPGTPW